MRLTKRASNDQYNIRCKWHKLSDKLMMMMVRTGVTVVLPDKPANCSVDVRGGGPGTREIDALNDGGLIDKVHAICLSGGSVYGLAAADGVCAWLGEKRLGYEVGPSPIPVSPIVPSAILFDNANGGDKNWGYQPTLQKLRCIGM